MDIPWSAELWAWRFRAVQYGGIHRRRPQNGAISRPPSPCMRHGQMFVAVGVESWYF